METLEQIATFLFSVIRVSTPLIFGAMAACVTQKAGLLNMGLESMMLASALAGVVVSGITKSAWLGVLAGMAAGVLITMILCYFAFVLKSDLYLTSIAMNAALVSGTVFVMFLLTGSKANTVSTINSQTIGVLNIPFIKDIPFVGKVLSGHNILTYVAFLVVVLIWFLLFKTKVGLRIRSVGENPQAAESVGISPRKIYFLSFGISGFLASLGGLYMSMGYLAWFARDMIAGRGFISMSAMNIAGAQPFGALFSSIMFGASDALSNYMQLTGTFPAEIIAMFPYVFTIVLLVIMTIFRVEREKRRRRLAMQ